MLKFGQLSGYVGGLLLHPNRSFSGFETRGLPPAAEVLFGMQSAGNGCAPPASGHVSVGLIAYEN